MTAAGFLPLRDIRDIEELERVPLEQRLLSWDVNDWIRHGFDLAPDKVAIRFIADGDPESPAESISYAELKRRTTQAANLFHALGVGPNAQGVKEICSLRRAPLQLRVGNGLGRAFRIAIGDEANGDLIRRKIKPMTDPVIDIPGQ